MDKLLFICFIHLLMLIYTTPNILTILAYVEININQDQ